MNIEANPRCALTTGSNEFRTGIDLVVEGKAVRLTDDDMLKRLAAMWLSKLDWPFDVVDGGFRDPATPGDDRDPDDLATALVFVWRRARCWHSPRVSHAAKPVTASEAQ